ncbi:nuclear transport factor 2 family protein [Chroococcidiopsis sp. CCMEE 29]|uniref:nuclear transport factor 2 family protein n=1 Tax=Chroococcidiopsis sp. CCMEE 29 TaxID=155894 RepID=UPI002020DD6E|nr:nuclear transport factor 2 family protein [Chroococcidiopsis sp. CCMEE 29]
MNTKTTSIQNTPSVLLKMEAAINAHDIDMFVNCFAPDFVGEQPVIQNETSSVQNRCERTGLLSSLKFLTSRQN